MDNLKKDKLDIMIQLSADALIKHNLEVGVSPDSPEVPFPKSLDRKIVRMIKHESGKPNYNEALIYVKRIAAVFLVTVSLCFALAMSVEAVRTAFWNAIVEWFDDYIAVVFVPEKEAPTRIEEYREPRLIPVGYERMLICKFDGSYSILYTVNGKEKMKYCQSILDNTIFLYDNETNDINTNIVNNGEIMIFDTEDEIKLIWNDKQYIYELIFYDDLTTQQMKTIAESVS